LLSTPEPIENATRASGTWLQKSFDRLASLITGKRATIQATWLAILLWSAYAVDLATPGLLDRVGHVKGADFLHFYISASLLRAGRALDLYAPSAHASLQKVLLPESVGTYFVPMYGPQFYLLFEPVAALSYSWAALIWALLNTALYFACCYALLRKCAQLRSEWRLITLLAVAYPAFFSLIAFGQSSAPALALFVLAFLSLQNRRTFVAGLAIGSLVYKPQLALSAVLILLGAGEWKVISGAITAAAAQLGFAWVYFGAKVMRRYLGSFAQLRSAEPFLEPKLYQMHSLRSFWTLLLPLRSAALAAYIISSFALVALGVMFWKRGKDLRLRYAALLLGTVLIAPHLWIYDLVILVPAFLLVAEWVREHADAQSQARLWILLYACYVLPLLGPVAQFTHIQLSVIAFTLTMVELGRRNRTALIGEA